MIFIFSDKPNIVKENNFQDKIKQELKSQKFSYNKLAISIIPVFDKNIFLSEPIYIAQTIVTDQLDIPRESQALYSQVFNYLKFSRNGSNIIDIKIKIEKL